jgi:CspA family cold shock protein
MVRAMNGEIVWYSSAKRYGFVRPADGGGDVMFRLTESEARALAPVEPGTEVHFLLADTPKGPLASRLERGLLPEP